MNLFYNFKRDLYLWQNDDFHENGISKGFAVWIDGLPGGTVCTGLFRCNKGDVDDSLRPGSCGIKGLLGGCAHVKSADKFQTVTRVPVAGAVVLYLPLFVHTGAGFNDGAVGKGQVF